MSYFIFWKKELFIISILIVIICALPIVLLTYGAPPIYENTSKILDRHGQIIQTENDLNNLQFTDIPPILVDATLAVEDRTFFTHKGFDGKGIVRAMFANIRSKSRKEGASTITQQLAKNMYLTNEKTWIRKIKEAMYTIRLEYYYDKEALFAAYLDSIYYGHGIYGVRQASEYYFGKTLDELTIAEIALLVGIPKGPTYYSPHNNMNLAIKRTHVVLEQMVTQQVISEEQKMTAQKEQWTLAEVTPSSKNSMYFTDIVWREAANKLNISMQALKQAGLTIHTTYDPQVQHLMEQTVADEFEQTSTLEVAVMSMRAGDGAILGLLGGRSYTDSSFNRAVDAKRMVGSTFKPFVYYAALENDFTAATLLRSEPLSMIMGEDYSYEPQNYGNYYAYGPVTLAQALAVSDNIYAVKTQAIIGTDKIIDTVRRFGIQTQLDPTPSLALGTATIPLIHMVRAYSIIANGGTSVEAHTVQKIENAFGDLLYEHRSVQKQILSAHKVFILTELMKGMFNPKLSSYAYVTGSSLLPKITHQYAGKSGTTDFDHWMIGFTQEVVTGVWIGYDKPAPIAQKADARIAKNIWVTVMEEIVRDEVDNFREMPDDMEEQIIDRDTGLLATDACPHPISLVFEKGTAPTTVCTKHVEQTEPTTNKPSVIGRFFQWIKTIFNNE